MKITLQDDSAKHIDLPEAIFAVDANDSVVWKIITIYSKRRIKTAKNKGRSEISFSGKKPWQQKGLGKARAGTKASPLWRKGGVTFAKSSIDYRNKFKVNKKEYRHAIKVMLSDHLRAGTIKVVDDVQPENLKTKGFKELMAKYDFAKTGKPNNWTGLILLGDLTESVFYASANLYEYMVTDVRGLDPLTLKHASELLITREALKQIEEWLS